jgi:hypothetical protein
MPDTNTAVLEKEKLSHAYGEVWNRDRRFTPYSLIELQKNLWKSATSNRETCFGRVEVEGKYIENTSSRKYSNGYYDLVEDMNPGGSANPSQLTLVVPGHIREKLSSGKSYVFSGLMNAVPESGGRWKTIFTVDFLAGEITPTISPEEEELFRRKKSILDMRIERPLRDMGRIIADAVSENRPLKMVLFYGASAIVDSDVQKGMGHTCTLHPFEITEERINMSRPEEIAAAVRNIPDGTDIAALVRGGGTGVDVFDSLDIADSVLECGCCIVSAVGHEQDHPFIEKVADRAFATPTDLGNILLQMVERAVEERDGSRGKLIEQVKKPFEEEIASLKKTRSELEKRIDEARKSMAETTEKMRLEMEKQFESKNENLLKEHELKIREMELSAEKLKTAKEEAEKKLADMDSKPWGGNGRNLLLAAAFLTGAFAAVMVIRFFLS